MRSGTERATRGAYVAAQAGSHFDPAYLAAFLAVDWEPVVEAATHSGWR